MIRKNKAVPEIKNGGKVETKEGDAIEIKRAIELDTSPSVPNIPKKKETKATNTKATKEEVPKPEVIKPDNVKPPNIYSLEGKLIELGCILSDKLIGKDKRLNGESLSEKQISSINALVNLYKTLTKKEG